MNTVDITGTVLYDLRRINGQIARVDVPLPKGEWNIQDIQARMSEEWKRFEAENG